MHWIELLARHPLHLTLAVDLRSHGLHWLESNRSLIRVLFVNLTKLKVVSVVQIEICKEVFLRVKNVNAEEQQTNKPISSIVFQ